MLGVLASLFSRPIPVDTNADLMRKQEEKFGRRVSSALTERGIRVITSPASGGKR